MSIFINKKIAAAMALMAGMTASGELLAKVTPEEAARLGADLTPVGATKAGNEAGTIPAWPAVIDEAGLGYLKGKHYPDPYADEEPLFEITAENVGEYTDNLSEGQLALLKLYPESFKMKVYPSHRTAVMPDWVNEQTRTCATQADTKDDGNGIENAAACIPFPIPQTGVEVVWNHLLRYQGLYREAARDSAVPTASGRYTLDSSEIKIYFPYYNVKQDHEGILSKFLPHQTAPARFAGDTFLFIDSLSPSDEPRKTWRYFVGQRRVRKAPVFEFDTPIPISQGISTMDTWDMFYGSTSRYDWELKGKKEIYIPYNSYKLGSGDLSYEDMLKSGHVDAELPRYELHRMWVVEAKLKAGEKHIYPRRTLYVDEDSWMIHLHDMYDKEDKLWRTAHRYSRFQWDANAMDFAAEAHHDLNSRRYYVRGMSNEHASPADYSQPIPPKNYFTPATVRKVGIR